MNLPEFKVVAWELQHVSGNACGITDNPAIAAEYGEMKEPLVTLSDAQQAIKEAYKAGYSDGYDAGYSNGYDACLEEQEE